MKRWKVVCMVIGIVLAFAGMGVMYHYFVLGGKNTFSFRSPDPQALIALGLLLSAVIVMHVGESRKRIARTFGGLIIAFSGIGLFIYALETERFHLLMPFFWTMAACILIGIILACGDVIAASWGLNNKPSSENRDPHP